MTKTKTEKQRENDAKISDAVATLTQLSSSNLTSSHTRKVIVGAIATLGDIRQDAMVRAATAIEALEDLAQDPSMPSYTRVGLWTVLSKLEAIRG